MRRPLLRFEGVLVAVMYMFVNTAKATSSTSSCVCTLLVVGSASNNTLIEQATVDCVGHDCASVQLAVAPAVMPFAKSFTGTKASVAY